VFCIFEQRFDIIHCHWVLSQHIQWLVMSRTICDILQQTSLTQWRVYKQPLHHSHLQIYCAAPCQDSPSSRCAPPMKCGSCK
jgi:hypothetical protein